MRDGSPAKRSKQTYLSFSLVQDNVHPALLAAEKIHKEKRNLLNDCLNKLSTFYEIYRTPERATEQGYVLKVAYPYEFLVDIPFAVHCDSDTTYVPTLLPFKDIYSVCWRMEVNVETRSIKWYRYFIHKLFDDVEDVQCYYTETIVPAAEDFLLVWEKTLISLSAIREATLELK